MLTTGGTAQAPAGHFFAFTSTYSGGTPYSACNTLPTSCRPRRMRDSDRGSAAVQCHALCCCIAHSRKQSTVRHGLAGACTCNGAATRQGSSLAAWLKLRAAPRGAHVQEVALQRDLLAGVGLARQARHAGRRLEFALQHAAQLVCAASNAGLAVGPCPRQGSSQAAPFGRLSPLEPGWPDMQSGSAGCGQAVCVSRLGLTLCQAAQGCPFLSVVASCRRGSLQLEAEGAWQGGHGGGRHPGRWRRTLHG